ncbi:hypothetical protein OSTOST_10118 [Ostertagia ostertagi]
MSLCSMEDMPQAYNCSLARSAFTGEFKGTSSFEFSFERCCSASNFGCAMWLTTKEDSIQHVRMRCVFDSKRGKTLGLN